MRPRLLVGLLLLSATAVASACSGAAATPTPTSSPSPKSQTIFEFIGHDATLIVAPDGTRIISDPYSLHPFGLSDFPKGLSASVVTVSHDHNDHNNSAAVQGNPQIITAAGTTQVGQVKITGYESDHGVINGESQGPNIVFVFEVGGVKIVHLGAAGLISQPDILTAIKGANLAIMDAMGDEAHPTAQQIDQLRKAGVQAIVPGHYSVDSVAKFFDSDTMDEVLAKVPSDLPVARQGSTVAVAANMPQEILVLTPSALDTNP